MDTWNRLANLRGEGVGGLEEISQRTYMYLCMAHGHRPQCVESWGFGAVQRGTKEEKIGDICNKVNNKKKETKK